MSSGKGDEGIIETTFVELSEPDLSIILRALKAYRGVRGEWDDVMIDDVSSRLLDAKAALNL